MKNPISHRVVKLLSNPYKAKLLTEYMSNPEKKDNVIFLVEIDDDTMDIYEVDREGFPINEKGEKIVGKKKQSPPRVLEHAQ